MYAKLEFSLSPGRSSISVTIPGPATAGTTAAGAAGAFATALAALLGLLRGHAGQMQAKLVGAGHSDTACTRVRPTVLLSQGVACHNLNIACGESCRLMQCVYALAVVDSTYVERMVWFGLCICLQVATTYARVPQSWFMQQWMQRCPSSCKRSAPRSCPRTVCPTKSVVRVHGCCAQHRPKLMPSAVNIHTKLVLGQRGSPTSV